jgi:hypothetical protein
MTAHSDEYAPFIPDGRSVQDYSTGSILPVGAELEELSLSVVADFLFKPIGIPVEVYYLDRNARDAIEPTTYGGRGTITEAGCPVVASLLYKMWVWRWLLEN